MPNSPLLSQQLLKQGPPAILLRSGSTRWGAWSRRALIAAALLLFGGVAFLAGWSFKEWSSQQSRANRQPLAVPQESSTAAADTGVSIAEAGPFGLESKIRQQLSERRALDGLDIEALAVSPDSASPMTLKYQFTVANAGRPYVGRMVFVIQGVLNGHSLVWLYPTDRQRSDPRFEMRVERYFQGEGSIPLPAGFEPGAVALQLHEAQGVRASRTVLLDAGRLPSGGRK